LKTRAAGKAPPNPAFNADSPTAALRLLVGEPVNLVVRGLTCMSPESPPCEPVLRVNHELVDGLRTPYRPFEGKEANEQYVAFLDILGFGNAVRTQFDETLRIYENLLDKLRILRCFEIGGEHQRSL
jgi:hypothetical protein